MDWERVRKEYHVFACICQADKHVQVAFIEQIAAESVTNFKLARRHSSYSAAVGWHGTDGLCTLLAQVAATARNPHGAFGRFRYLGSF